MTLDPLPLLLGGVPAGDVLSCAWAVLRWLGGALVWLLDHGLLVALATGAAAWIAWQAHRREERRREEREAANDARIEALAFALHRQVQLWWWEREETGYRLAAIEALEEAEPMMDQMQDLTSLTPEASAEKARLATEAVSSFYRAVEVLRVLSRGGSAVAMEVIMKPGEEVPGPTWLWERAEDLRREAKGKLRDAAGGLADPDSEHIIVKVPPE